MSTKSSSFMDTKLSRSEVIELAIEQCLTNLETQIDSLDEQKLAEKRLTPAEIMSIVHLIDVDVGCSYDDASRLYPRMDELASRQPMPALVLERCKRVDAINAKIRPLQDLRNRLHNNKSLAKSIILKEILESSEDGRDLLSKIKDFSVKIESAFGDKKFLSR